MFKKGRGEGETGRGEGGVGNRGEGKTERKKERGDKGTTEKERLR